MSRDDQQCGLRQLPIRQSLDLLRIIRLASPFCAGQPPLIFPLSNSLPRHTQSPPYQRHAASAKDFDDHVNRSTHICKPKMNYGFIIKGTDCPVKGL